MNVLARTFLLILLLASRAWAAEPPLQTVTLQLQWKHQFQFAGFYAAREKGFYKEVGLDVSFHEFDGKSDATTEVVAGRQTFGTSGSNLLRERLNGVPVVMLSNYFKRSPLVFLARPEITQPGDLKGKRVEASLYDLKGVAFQTMLKKFGMRIEDMVIVPNSYSMQGFMDGKVDAVEGFLTQSTFYLLQNKAPYNVIDPGNYGAEFYDTNLLTSETFARQHPGVVRAFKQASDRGWVYALEHPEEIVGLILKKYNTQNKTREALLFEARETIKVMLPGIFPVGSIDRNKLQRMAELFVQAGEAKSLATVTGFVFDAPEGMASAEPPLSLNAEEHAFLNNHPVIRVSNEYDWPPYDFYENGKPEGYSVDLMRLLAGKMGVKFEFVQGKTWDDLVNQFCAGKIDLLHPADKPAKVLRCGEFSPPIINETSRFLTRQDHKPVNGIADLFGSVVASPKGWEQTEILRKRYGDKFRIVETPGIREAIEAVNNGDADFTIDYSNVLTYRINKFAYTNLKVQGIWNIAEKGGDFNSLYVATRKDWKVFHGIVDKALAAVSIGEKRKLQERWFGAGAETVIAANGAERETESSRISLTPDERTWLAAHPVIRVQSEKDYPPYDFSIGDRPQGYSIDLLNLLAPRIGIKVEYVNGPSWSQMEELFKQGKLNLLHTLTRTPEREKIGLYSGPFSRSRSVFVVRKSEADISGFAQLQGKTIAVGKGWAQEEFLKKNYPGIKLLMVKNIEEMLDAVANGKADATVEGEGVLQYWMRKKGFNDLKISGWAKELDRGEAFSFHFFAHKDAPQLIAMLDKAMASVTPAEIQALQEKWFGKQEQASDQPETKRIALTPAEQAYIRAHPVVVLGTDTDYAPVAIRKADGSAEGIVPDIVHLIEQRTGLRFCFELGRWNDVVKKAEERKLDGLANSIASPERATYFTLSTPFLASTSVVVVKRGNPLGISNLLSLVGKRMAVHKGNIAQEYGARKVHATPVYRDTLGKMIQAVIAGEADFMAWDENFTYAASQKGLTSFVDIAFTVGEAQSVSLALRKDRPELLSIVNRALADIGEAELLRIKNKWVVDSKESGKLASKVELTDAERAYLVRKGTIRMCVLPDWLPYERINEKGEHEGIGADMIALMQARLGVKFELYPTKEWSESLAAIRAHQCDILPIASDLPSRRDAMNFTRPYFTQPFVIATKSNELFIKDASEIGQRKVGVLKGYSFIELLKQRYPDIQITEVKNARDGLERVRSGELWGYIDAMASIAYQLQKYSMLDLKIAGKIEFDIDFSLASRNDEPLLAGVMQKATDAISGEERQAIANHWISIKFEQGFDYLLLWKIGSGVTLVLLGFYAWNRKLSKLNKELEQAQTTLQRTSVELNTILQNAPVGIVMTDKDRNIVRWNRYGETEIFRCQPGQYIGQSSRIFYPSDESYEVFARDAFAAFAAGAPNVTIEHIFSRYDGSTYLAHVVGSLVDQADPSKGAIWVITDVTGQRMAQAELQAARDDALEKTALVEQQHQLVVKTLDQVATLLNNSGQGFLSFGMDLHIDEGYSRECVNIFQCDALFMPLPELLCPDDVRQREFIAKTLPLAMENGIDNLRRDAYIDLLPKEYCIGKRYYEAEYKPLGDTRMMLVLTDVTDEKKLSERLALERTRLEFVVNALENRDDLLETLRDYDTFRSRTLPDLLSFGRQPQALLVEIFRYIHTFKSLFSQASLPTLPEVLHELETRLGRLRERGEALEINDIKRELGITDLGEALECDLALLREKLGDEYFRLEKEIHVLASVLDALETEAGNLYGTDSRMLMLIHQLRFESLRKMIEPHFKAAEQLAGRQQKLLAPIRYEGDAALLDPEVYGVFCKSLIHLFRNAVDHGIEDADTRLLADKDETATIRCEVCVASDHLTLSISDDGRGMDAALIRATAIEQGIVSADVASTLDDTDTYRLIFADGLSTREEISAISGRGVGLSVVQQELERLGGTVHIDSMLGLGTRFTFTLPYKPVVVAEQKISFQQITKLLVPLPRVMQTFCVKHLKLDVTIDEASREFTAANLYEFTALVLLGGVLNATLGISIERPLLLEMTRRFEPNFLADEIESLADSVGAEIANTIVGNATVYFTHLAHHVEMGTPDIVPAGQHVDRFGKRVFRGFMGQCDAGQFILFCVFEEKRAASRHGQTK